MDNTYDLMRIYGIPPSKYSEDNPDDLFLSNLPSLEQIASFNLAMHSQGNQTTNQQGVGPGTSLPPVPDLSGVTSTPTTSMPTDITGILGSGQSTAMMPGSASAELPSQTGSLTQQITDFSNPYPVTAQSIQYLNGFIRTQIGRRAQIQFLMGNSDLVTKDGFLLGVGANYILINEIGTNDITACDFYNIKFIRFLY